MHTSTFRSWSGDKHCPFPKRNFNAYKTSQTWQKRITWKKYIHLKKLKEKFTFLEVKNLSKEFIPELIDSAGESAETVSLLSSSYNLFLKMVDNKGLYDNEVSFTCW